MPTDYDDLEQQLHEQRLELEELRAEVAALRIENEELWQRLEAKHRPKYRLETSKETLESWWWELSEEWQKAFNQAVLSYGEVVALPSERELRRLFSSTSLEVVGSGILLFGLRQLSFQLTDWTGLQRFQHLQNLNLSGNALKNLDGIQPLQRLETLNLTSNQITTLRQIRHANRLKNLVLRDNRLTNLTEIQHLQDLEWLDILNNKNLKTLGRLSELKNLKQLHLFDFKRTIAVEVQTIKTQLPDLQIVRV